MYNNNILTSICYTDLNKYICNRQLNCKNKLKALVGRRFVEGHFIGAFRKKNYYNISNN